MNSYPAVVVKKGGFLSALACGLFGFLTVSVLCGTTVGLAAMFLINDKVERVFDFGERAIAQLSQWENAPPAVADMLRDARMPEYRDQLKIKARLADADGEGRGTRVSHRMSRGDAVLEVTNDGAETVSLLAIRVVAQNADEEPISDKIVYAATPAAFDECDFSDMPGTLMPGQTRKLRVRLDRVAQDGALATEISELRVWRPQNAGGKKELTAGEASDESKVASSKP